MSAMELLLHIGIVIIGLAIIGLFIFGFYLGGLASFAIASRLPDERLAGCFVLIVAILFMAPAITMSVLDNLGLLPHWFDWPTNAH